MILIIKETNFIFLTSYPRQFGPGQNIKYRKCQIEDKCRFISVNSQLNWAVHSSFLNLDCRVNILECWVKILKIYNLEYLNPELMDSN